MAGQAQPYTQRSLPQQAQMPQQTLAMLTNKFSNFAPGMPAAMPQNASMTPQAGLPLGVRPSPLAMQNAASAANLIGRFPIAGQMPNPMAFQNASPMAGLQARFMPPSTAASPIASSPLPDLSNMITQPGPMQYTSNPYIISKNV